ncbi:MAG: hypothetical protein ABI624_04975 [Casimicrobiaceae bacterium]
MYELHPSQQLVDLFAEKPYQGASPMSASFLFVGLDANYHPAIGTSPAFSEIVQYHDNGVAFWRDAGVHHPFLLSSYKGDGRRYHRTFARIGFRPEHASLVSFVELLHVPTVGRSQLEVADLSTEHLRTVNDAMFNGKAHSIFVSAGVARLMRASGAFPQIGGAPIGNTGPLKTLFADGKRTVYLRLHFSNYGKFEAQLRDQAKAIGALLPRA